MEQVQSVLNGQGIIPRDVLSTLGRTALQEALQGQHSDLSLIEVQSLWTKLHETACSLAVSDKHLTAACNAVCVFVRQTRHSERHEVRNFAYSVQVWSEAFEVVHKAFGDGKNKPALQVLEMLVQVLQESEDQRSARTLLQKVISEKAATIFVGEPKHFLKEACITLSCFLRKAQNIVPLPDYFASCGSETILTFKRRCQQRNMSRQRVADQEMLANFLVALLLAASVTESRTAAIKLFALLCSKNEKFDLSNNVNVASLVIEQYLQANDEALKDFSADVFPAVLTDEQQFDKFLNQFDPTREFRISRLSIFLAILQVGRQKGFVDEEDLPSKLESAIGDKIPHRRTGTSAFQVGLMCGVPTIRLQIFHLLTSSSSTIAAVPLATLQDYTQSLRYVHDDAGTSYRDEFVSVSRRLVDRLQHSGHAAKRLENASTNLEISTRSNYASFLQSWKQFLCTELSPQASYQRHILALQVLRLIVTAPPSGGYDLISLLSDDACVLALLNLMFDAFDDVRSSSASLLVGIVPKIPQMIDAVLKDTRVVALGKRLSAKTNRADHADAVGKLLMLEAFVNVCSARFSTSQPDTPSMPAVSLITDALKGHLHKDVNFTPLATFPLHASLLGLSYLLRLSSTESMKVEQMTTEAIIQTCQKIWGLVQEHLCVDSPETEQEGNKTNIDQGPKDLLAYSWTALRDSSLVMQALLDTQPPNHFLFRSVGTLCFDQLKRLRHRGAFSTVAQTFTQCCQKSRSAQMVGSSNLNEAWLEAAFDEIEEQSGKLTRRSAGLPSMFAALLDPLDTKQFLASTRRLAQVASSPVNIMQKVEAELRLPQVHALNCLKDAMTNSRFRIVTESLVAPMLNLSATCLSSKTWAIRNCGLMLFRACIDRLAPGTSFTYGKYATGIDNDEVQTPLAVGIALLLAQQDEDNITIDENQPKSNEARSEIVFAALDLLSRLPSQHGTDEAVDKLIAAQFKSTLWAVRDHAARLSAYRAVASNVDASLSFSDLMNRCCSSNEYHGRLLSYRYLLQNMWSKWEISERTSRSSEILLSLSQLVKGWDNNRHQLVQAAAMDILNDILTYALVAGCVPGSVLECAVCFDKILATKVCDMRFFLLRRAVALNHACRCLHQSKVHKESIVVGELLGQLLQEYDVVLYVIEQLEQVATTYPNEFLQLLLTQLSLHNSAEVRPAVFKAILGCSLAPKFSPTLAQIEHMRAVIDFRGDYSRDLWNAHVCFAARVAVICHLHALSPVEDILNQLVVAIRTLQQDETEMPTRFHAVEAIAILAPLYSPTGDAQRQVAERSRFRLLLILYDLLNDDDEDVRAVACTATYNIIQCHTRMQHVLTGCAVAAREALIGILPRHFGNLQLLVPYAFMKLIGIRPPAGTGEWTHLVVFCQRKSVQELVETELQRARDLFAEERQNLYIDDVAEVDVWSTVVGQSLEYWDKFMLEVLSEWVEDGLRFLANLLQQDLDEVKGTDDGEDVVRANVVHPLGLTYNAEILIICVRVIAVAGLVRRHGENMKTDSQSSTTRSTLITDRLRAFQPLCQSRVVHERISITLTQSLRD